MEDNKDKEDTGQGKKRQMYDTTVTEDDIARLEEIARREGGIPRRQSLPRTPEKKLSKRPKIVRSPLTKDAIENIVDILNKSITGQLGQQEGETDTDAQPESNDEVFKETEKTAQGKIQEFFSKKRAKTTSESSMNSETKQDEDARNKTKTNTTQTTNTGTIPKIRTQERSGHTHQNEQQQQTQREITQKIATQWTQQGNREKEKRDKTVQEIIEAKNKIITATTRYSGTKVQFNREEQTIVRENLDKITDIMLAILYEQGRRDEQELRNRKIEENQNLLMTQLLKQGEEIKVLKEQLTGGKRQQETVSQKETTTNRQRNYTRKETGQERTQYITSTDDYRTQQGYTTDGGTDIDMGWERQKRRQRRKQTKTYAQATGTGADKESDKKEGWKTPEPKETLTTQYTLKTNKTQKKY